MNINKLLGIITEPDEGAETNENICWVCVCGITYINNINFKVLEGDLIGVNPIGDLIIKQTLDRYTLGQVVSLNNNKCYLQVKNI